MFFKQNNDILNKKRGFCPAFLFFITNILIKFCPFIRICRMQEFVSDMRTWFF